MAIRTRLTFSILVCMETGLRLLSVIPEKLIWRKVDARGSPPTPRGWHSACIINKQMFVFGGCADVALNDLHVFDLGNV